jgi:hypothetical protein
MAHGVKWWGPREPYALRFTMQTRRGNGLWRHAIEEALVGQPPPSSPCYSNDCDCTEFRLKEAEPDQALPHGQTMHTKGPMSPKTGDRGRRPSDGMRCAHPAQNHARYGVISAPVGVAMSRVASLARPGRVFDLCEGARVRTRAWTCQRAVLPAQRGHGHQRSAPWPVTWPPPLMSSAFPLWSGAGSAPRRH